MSGEVAVAVPRIELAGQAPALNWTLVQGLLMCSLSMNSDFGRITVVLAMLASPLGALRTAFRAGLPVRFIFPFREIFSPGPKPSSPQSVALKPAAGEPL